MSFFVKRWKTTGAVGAARDPLARQAGLKVTRDGVGRAQRVVVRWERGDVDARSAGSELERFGEQASITIHVRRVEDARGKLGVERAPDELEAASAVAEVKVQDARLAAHQS